MDKSKTYIILSKLIDSTGSHGPWEPFWDGMPPDYGLVAFKSLREAAGWILTSHGDPDAMAVMEVMSGAIWEGSNLIEMLDAWPASLPDDTCHPDKDVVG